MAELLQNCDLPPPDQALLAAAAEKTMRQGFNPFQVPNGNKIQNQSLLRAVQLSQTRAREAEKKALEASIKAEQITALLLEDSLRLHAAMQWVRMLETEISLLKQPESREQEDEEKDEAACCSRMKCCLALALCLGIAGAGFVLRSYIFLSLLPVIDNTS